MKFTLYLMMLADDIYTLCTSTSKIYSAISNHDHMFTVHSNFSCAVTRILNENSVCL